MSDGSAMEKLQLLSLVDKLTNDIKTFIGLEDKSLAEFIIDLHQKSSNKGKDVESFRHSLVQVGADFPQELVEKINETILKLHPSYKKAKNSAQSSSAKVEPSQSQARPGFSALSIPDSEPVIDETDGNTQRDQTTSRHSGRYDEVIYRDSDTRERSPPWKRSRDYRRSSPPDAYHRERSPPWKQNSHSRGRSRSPIGNHGRRNYEKGESRESVDDEAIMGKVYDATIRNITHYGAFANIHGIRHNPSGLIHVSQMAGYRVEDPADVVSRGMTVPVKVIRIENGKISLSMKEATNPSDARDDGYMAAPIKKPKKRLTSPERWELRQLIASGAISAADYPELQAEALGNETSTDDFSQSSNPFEMEEDVDIELKDEEPPFLAGQTQHSLELSPIRVVKAPDGSLNRAAMSGATLAKERRDKRQEEQRAKQREGREEQKQNIRLGQDPLADLIEDAGDNTNENVSAAADSHTLQWKKAGKQTFGKRSDMPIELVRKSLPVYQLREQITNAIRDNQVMIIVGDTGSGKTTQITQYLYEEGFANNDMKIACTQPRRVAAQSVAKRVAEEVGCKVGDTVGYNVRFDDCTTPRTKIKYMTDGMLQREALIDPNMSQYSVIMLDEAHERTIATDVLFALLKKAARRRPDLKLIVTSATLDAEKFSRYFGDSPILYIPGRTFPVSIEFVKEPEMDYLDAALRTIMEIHLSEPCPGDILVFLTGQEEIDTSCDVLEERMKTLRKNSGSDSSIPDLIVLPVYAAMPSEMQSRIFDPAPPNGRKVILATNIAETSVTIDGIYYVVDPGFVKINAYDPKLGMDSLQISPISQAQANQRAGRAGRTGPGKCFRLYTQQAYEVEMLPNTIPEIQRQNLSHTILMLKAMGINDLLNFDFMDPPPANTMLTALEELYQLSALDDEGLLTRLGRKMADFPMEPAMAKVLISSVDKHCSEEILTIIAMLSVQAVFYRPREKKDAADQKHAKFKDQSGDHLTLLNVYNGWARASFSSHWCTTNFIQERSLKRAREVRKQLVTIIQQRYKHRLESCGMNTEDVRRVLCTGYFRNAARKDPQEGYKTLVESTAVFLHPSSSLFFKPAEYVIYHTLLLTSKEYMTCVSTIDPKWLVEAAPHFFKVASSDVLSKRKKNETIQPLFNRYSRDQNDWRLSAQKKIIQAAQRSGFS